MQIQSTNHQAGLTHGWAICDLEKKDRYVDLDNHTKGRKLQNSKIYSIWESMIQRAYSVDWQTKYPSYKGTLVCEEWKLASTFKEWYDNHYVEGWDLDKDYLSPEGSKLYSPETCVFIPHILNTFIIGSDKPYVGSSRTKRGTYRAMCKDPIASKYEYLGEYKTPEEAHEAWKARKHIHANRLADEYTGIVDQRVIERLKTMFEQEKKERALDWLM